MTGPQTDSPGSERWIAMRHPAPTTAAEVSRDRLVLLVRYAGHACARTCVMCVCASGACVRAQVCVQAPGTTGLLVLVQSCAVVLHERTNTESRFAASTSRGSRTSTRKKGWLARMGSSTSRRPRRLPSEAHSSSCHAGKPQDPRSRRARAHAPVRSVRAHRVRTRRVRSSQCRAKPAVPAAMRRLCSRARSSASVRGVAKFDRRRS